MLLLIGQKRGAGDVSTSVPEPSSVLGSCCSVLSVFLPSLVFSLVGFFLAVGDMSLCLNDHRHHPCLKSYSVLVESVMVHVPAANKLVGVTVASRSLSVYFQWVVGVRELLPVVCKGGPCPVGAML